MPRSAKRSTRARDGGLENEDVALNFSTPHVALGALSRQFCAPPPPLRALEPAPRAHTMAQLHARALGVRACACSAVGCSCLFGRPHAAPLCRSLPGAPPRAQLRAGPAVLARPPRRARTAPKPRVVAVEAKRRMPTPYNRDLCVGQGYCALCQIEFTPARHPDIAGKVAARHYRGRQHFQNEKHALRVIERFPDATVEELFSRTFICDCGYWAGGVHDIGIHLGECKAQRKPALLLSKNGSTGDIIEATVATEQGATQELEQPEEEIWRC